MKTLLRMSLAAAAVLCLLSAGAQTPAGDAVSDFDYAVQVVERAYAGYPDKTAGREAEYAALKGRLQSEISGDRDVYDAIAEYLGWFDDSHLQTPGAEAYRAKSLHRDTDYAGRMKRYDPQFMHCRGRRYVFDPIPVVRPDRCRNRRSAGRCRGLPRLGLRKPGRRYPRQYGRERQCL